MSENSEQEIAREAERVIKEYESEHQASQSRLHDSSQGHFDKLAVLQAGILALSVTFWLVWRLNP